MGPVYRATLATCFGRADRSCAQTAWPEPSPGPSQSRVDYYGKLAPRRVARGTSVWSRPSRPRFWIRLNARLFSDDEFLSFVVEAVKAFWAEIDLYPCLLDAEVFASYDGENAWTDAKGHQVVNPGIQRRLVWTS